MIPGQMDPEVFSEEFPEHRKMAAVNHKSQIVFDFNEWMNNKGFAICKPGVEEYFPISSAMFDDLLYKWLEIDKEKFLAEKEEIYRQVREEANKKHSDKEIPS